MKNVFKRHTKEKKSLELAKALQEQEEKFKEDEIERKRRQELDDAAIAKLLQEEWEKEDQNSTQSAIQQSPQSHHSQSTTTSSVNFQSPLDSNRSLPSNPSPPQRPQNLYPQQSTLPPQPPQQPQPPALPTKPAGYDYAENSNGSHPMYMPMPEPCPTSGTTPIPDSPINLGYLDPKAQPPTWVNNPGQPRHNNTFPFHLHLHHTHSQQYPQPFHPPIVTPSTAPAAAGSYNQFPFGCPPMNPTPNRTAETCQPTTATQNQARKPASQRRRDPKIRINTLSHAPTEFHSPGMSPRDGYMSPILPMGMPTPNIKRHEVNPNSTTNLSHYQDSLYSLADTSRSTISIIPTPSEAVFSKPHEYTPTSVTDQTTESIDTPESSDSIDSLDDFHGNKLGNHNPVQRPGSVTVVEPILLSRLSVKAQPTEDNQDPFTDSFAADESLDLPFEQSPPQPVGVHVARQSSQKKSQLPKQLKQRQSTCATRVEPNFLSRLPTNAASVPRGGNNPPLDFTPTAGPNKVPSLVPMRGPGQLPLKPNAPRALVVEPQEIHAENTTRTAKVYPTITVRAGLPNHESNPTHGRKSITREGSLDDYLAKNDHRLLATNGPVVMPDGFLKSPNERCITVRSVVEGKKAWIKLYPWDTGKKLAERIHSAATYKTQKILSIKIPSGHEIPLDDTPVFNDWSVVEKHQNGAYWDVEWEPIENSLMDTFEGGISYIRSFKQTFKSKDE
ncbi:hypothetical protein CLU79DRAFT_752152 [Phycomyces nitens]|nr:hypothetical protein CLU79DRAFT_752152 [Phycomyces nitens]